MDTQMERSQMEEPSAQVLARVSRQQFSTGQNLPPQEFNPEHIHPEQLKADHQLEIEKIEIYADIPLDGKLPLFWMTAIVAFLAFLLGAAILADGSIKYVQREDDSVGCQNPTYFREDGSIACSHFDADFNPSLGVVVTGLSKFNQYLDISLLIPSSTSKTTISFQARLSVYSVSKGPLSLFGYAYYKDEPVVQNQVISMNPNKTNLYYSLYSDQIQGFMVPIHLVRPIKAQNYLVVVTLMDNQGQYLQTSKGITLSSYYISSSWTLTVGGIRLVAMLVLTVTTFLFGRVIRNRTCCQQQKLILITSIVICVTLDPFFLVTLVAPNIFSDVVSSFLMALQYLALLMFLNIVYCTWLKETEVTWKRMLLTLLGTAIVLSPYFFVTTFTQFCNPPQNDTARTVLLTLKLLLLCAFVNIIHHKLSFIFRIWEFRRRHLCLFFLSSFIVFVVLTSVLCLDFRVFSQDGITSIIIPPFIAIYLISLQFLYKPECHQAPQLSTTSQPQLQQDLINLDAVKDNVQKQQYFDIEGTEQFEKSSAC